MTFIKISTDDDAALLSVKTVTCLQVSISLAQPMERQIWKAAQIFSDPDTEGKICIAPSLAIGLLGVADVAEQLGQDLALDSGRELNPNSEALVALARAAQQEGYELLILQLTRQDQARRLVQIVRSDAANVTGGEAGDA